MSVRVLYIGVCEGEGPPTGKDEMEAITEEKAVATVETLEMLAEGFDVPVTALVVMFAETWAWR